MLTKLTSSPWLARACVLPILAAPVSNPDLFWHLNAAERILAEGRLPRYEASSYTLFGSSWVDFEWLFQLVVLGLERLGGWSALWALKALLWAALAALVERLGGRLVLFLWCAASLGRAELKPELFSAGFFLAGLLTLERAPRLVDWKSAVLYFALWANLHPGFPMGLGLLALYAALGPRADRARLGAALAAGAAATLVNPYGWGLWQVLGEHARWTPPLSRAILEWGPLTARNPFHGPQLALLASAAAAGIAAAMLGRPPRRALSAAAAALGLAGLLHSRLMAFASVPLALILVESAAALPRAGRWGRAAGWAAGLAAAAFLVFQGAGLAWPPRAFEAGHFPVSALDFVESEREEFRRRRVYNEWGWGGYLARRLGEDARVFYDGRYVFHPLLAQVLEAERTPEAWGAFMDRWSVDWVLVAHRPRRPDYFPAARWVLVHRDDVALVYVRRSAFAPSWVRAREAISARGAQRDSAVGPAQRAARPRA